VDRNLFQGFAWRGGLPLFLGGFLDRVFDRGTGQLLDEPCVDSILAVRVLTHSFGKILRKLPKKRVEGAMQSYIRVDEEVRMADKVIPLDLLQEFERLSVILWADVFTEVERELLDGSLLPKHGPGVTADRLLGNQKYNQVEWTQRLEPVFPFLETCLPSPSYKEELTRVAFLEPDAERPVKVTAVPKTLKTPRIIAIEPTCMQFTQQAIAECMIKNLERRHVGINTRRNLAYGFVGFSDQNPNREMARVGSRDKTLATLDMSEASDRVSNQHVVSLLRRWPHLSEAIQATRSTKADVRGHGVIHLAKYASMGSALCFPIEALVFTTLVFVGIQQKLSCQLTRKDIQSYRGQVRVYGDDIIVPVDCVDSVIQTLEAFGLKVNKDKSFWNGKFRESCGGDYYDGEWVTPIRVRRDIPSSLKRAKQGEVASLVSLRNQLYLAGFWKTCAWLDTQIEPLLKGRYPVCSPTIAWSGSDNQLATAKSNLLGRASFLRSRPYEVWLDVRSGEKMHKRYDYPLVKGWYVSSRIPKDSLDGPGALMKWYLKRGEEPFQDPRHLERAGRPLAVDIKLGWRSPA
jgi:hypothetical protein